MSDIDFSLLMESVARHPDIWGDPNPRFRKPNELRWGRHGARWISTAKGVWHDHETDERGGVLDLIKRELGLDKKEAIQWMERESIYRNGGDRQSPTRQHTSNRQLKEIVAEYEYTDEQGKPLFVVVRYKVPPPENKTFRQRKPDGSWTVKGVRQVLYRLPDVIEAISRGECVYIVEGEKDVENVRDCLGLTATCNAGGAGKWSEEHSKQLKGADVVWLPDNDDAGRSHVANGAITLRKYARRQRILDLPELDEKEDVSDWIEQSPDNNRTRLDDLVAKRARSWSAEPPETKFGAITWEHLDDPAPEFEYIIDEFFTAGDLSAVAGPSQSGKSFLAIHAGMLTACAAMDDIRELDFFGRKVVAGGLVIYQAGEGSRGVKKRLRAWRKQFGIPHDIKLPFVLLTSKIDLFRDKDIVPLIAEIKAWQAYYDLPLKMVFVDTLAASIPGAEENSAKDMTTVLTNCARIRDECGCHVSLVHHMNATGEKMRGSTAIFASLDNAVTVRRDEVTKVRTVTLAKQKDDEDDKSFRFELLSVPLGHRKDGKAITSCVCVEVGEKDALERSQLRKGLRLADQEHAFFSALIETLKESGVSPPLDLAVPTTVQCVVAWPYFREKFAAKLWREEGDDDSAHHERVKKALSRAGKSLVKFGIIGRYHEGKGGGFVWWTNKPVAGFGKTPIAAPAKPDEAGSDLLNELGESA